MTGLLSVPTEVRMNELVITLIGIYNLPERSDYSPKEYLCESIKCPDVLCSCCPLGNPDYINPDKEIFVTQIHKTSEVMNHETRNSTPD